VGATAADRLAMKGTFCPRTEGASTEMAGTHVWAALLRLIRRPSG